MARLYTDENFPVQTAQLLRKLGHDVLTCQESGRADKGIKDPEVLAYAIKLSRAVVTKNRGDYKRLHRKNPNHFGIVNCTTNNDFEEFAHCIHEKLLAEPNLAGKLVNVYRPG